MVASGIAPLVAMLMSIIVFAGASMVAAAQLLASGTPALLVLLAWQLAVATGILIRAGVPASWRLEFAAPLAFIAMTVPLLRDRAMVAAAVVAAATVVAGNALPLKLSIPLAALAGIGAGLAFERSWR